VNLPHTATGLAMHREHGLICAVPRDGGEILRIDESGKVDTVVADDKKVVHPVDVGLSAASDTIVVADNVANVLAATSTDGVTPKLYHEFDGQKWHAQDMSVAVTTDRHVLFGGNGPEGIFRFHGDDYTAERGPLLPSPGGVAADTASLKWAATQPPDEICVFEGEELLKKLKLPANKSHYRNGLLSFAPAGRLVVATRPSDEVIGEIWFIQYDTESDDIVTLFPWKKERMVDFVVGPRLLWEQHEPKKYKSIY
jgi:hypothetical protein